VESPYSCHTNMKVRVQNSSALSEHIYSSDEKNLQICFLQRHLLRREALQLPQNFAP
jgi:hypothetical protein